MILTHKITLSLDHQGERQIIDVVQGDTARAVEITLLENGEPWQIPEYPLVSIYYRRAPSGVGGVYDTLPDGSEAFSVDGNKLTIGVGEPITTIPGMVEVQVSLWDGGLELNSFSIWFHVQENLQWTEKDDECYVNLQKQIRQIMQGMDLTGAGNSVHYIAGDPSSISGTWIGTCEAITEYYEGLMIAYKTATTGGGVSTTLNINNLGAVSIKRNGMNYDANYYYSANSVLFLTYVEVDGVGYWQLTDVWWTDNDRKTSAASCSNEKLYLIGAKSVNANGVATYANSQCYIGEDNCLYSCGEKVAVSGDLPDALPNPQPLTVNGKSYDGSQAVELTLEASDDVPDYVRTEAERVAALVQSRQNANTISFILGSDIHGRVGLEGVSDQIMATTRHAAQAMEIIRKQVHLDFAGLLGDYLWDGDAVSATNETPEQALEMFRLIHEFFAPAFAGLPQFWAKGNHDILDDDSHVSQLTHEQVFANVGIYNSGAEFNSADRVMGYCYRDFADHRIRVVCMNTTKDYVTAVDTPQLNWLQSVLDVEDGWKVILLSHVPVDWSASNSIGYQTVLQFADKILCHIHGHTHNYRTGLVGDTTIARVAIPNIDYYRPNTYQANASFGEDTNYPKTADSANDTAFCVITIDLAQNKLYADHYGAGYDRVVDLTSGEAEGGGEEGGEGDEAATYTNQIPLSVSAFGGTEIYNGVGYKTGYRINSSFAEAQSSGMCCTGFIMANGADVLRVKNVTLSGSGTPYVLLYSSSGGGVITESISVLGTADGNGVYTYTLPDYTGAVRLSLGVIDDTSIVTINEEIA